MDLSRLTTVGDPHTVLKSIDKSAKLFDEVEALGHTAWLSGDLHDTKQNIDGYVLNFHYRRFRDSKIHWIIFPGNHDYYRLSECTDHALEVYGSLPNVTVVGGVTEIGGMWFVPYVHDQEKLARDLREIPDGAVVFGHFEVRGFDFGNGHMCDDGMPPTLFRRFKRVFSGHFHRYQSEGNFTYVGTPFSKDFGESNQTKYIGVYRRDEDRHELIETDFPRHLTFEVDADDVYSSSQGLDPGTVANDVVRVVLKGSAEAIASWGRIEGVRYDERPTDEAEVLIEESEDHCSQYVSWADKKGLAQQVRDAGLRLLREASK
jgi:DNA repair exonuclease SbcCD nuclease subunit